MNKQREQSLALGFILVGFVLLGSSRSKSPTPATSSAPSSQPAIKPNIRGVPKTPGLTLKSGPFTFVVLTDFSAKPLRKGDFAKVVFVAPNGQQEGLWVEITSIKGENGKEVFTGKIDSDPVIIKTRAGQVVTFSRANVKETEIKEG